MRSRRDARCQPSLPVGPPEFGASGSSRARSARGDRPRRSGLPREQLITVPVCIGPPLGVAMRIARETYETSALPLSYVGFAYRARIAAVGETVYDHPAGSSRRGVLAQPATSERGPPRSERARRRTVQRGGRLRGRYGRARAARGRSARREASAHIGARPETRALVLQAETRARGA